jgi:uncharacterized membrane protein
MLALLLVATLLCSVANANLSLQVTADERRVIDLGVFGYDRNGVFQLEVKHFFVDDSEGALLNAAGRYHHNESMGFALLTVESAQDARYIRTFARTDAKERRVCLDSDELAPKASDGTTLPRYFFKLNNASAGDVVKKYESILIDKPGLYALFFYNCWGYQTTGPLKPFAVSFEAEATEYNVGSAGQPNYLPVGHQPLPSVFFVFFLIFAGLAALWHREMRNNVQHVHHIHKVMMFLVVVKTLSLFFEMLKYSHYAKTGHASVWDLFYYAFLTVKGISLFAVVILLGSGWSLLKAMLSEQDKKLLMVILPAQVLVNMCLAIVEETNEGTKGWGNWSDILRVVDVICCCIVLLPIVWSIKNLREASEQDEKAVQALSRMRLFRTFYIVVVAYIYFTRIILVMIEGSLPYSALWIASLLAEIVAVVFYTYSGLQFRPAPENPFLRLNREDLQELEGRTEVGEESHYNTDASRSREDRGARAV